MKVWHTGGVLNKELYEELFMKQVAILKFCASKETSSDPENWRKDDPFHGHCAVVALLIQKEFGGDILRASLKDVKGYENMKSHYWNRLHSGIEVDLAADQFKGDDRNLVPKGEKSSAEHILSYQSTKNRFELLLKKHDAFMRDMY